MNTVRSLALLLFIPLSSYGQEHKPAAAAIALDRQAIHMFLYNNNDSDRKALSLLDEATAIDDNYFPGYENKLMFCYRLKEYDKAILAINDCLRLRPHNYILCTQGGVCYESLGDTTAAKAYYKKSLAYSDAMLDTMRTSNDNYLSISITKINNLILLNNIVKAHELAATLYAATADDGSIDGDPQRAFLHFLINRNKEQLLDYFMNPGKYVNEFQPHSSFGH